MTAPDAAALAALHARAFTRPAPWSCSEFQTYLDDPACFVECCDTADGTLAGFALFRVVADEAEILTLAVAPNLRRKGIARRVLHDALQRLQGRAKWCFLEVASSNAAARALYEQAGFTQVGLRKGYYRAAQSGAAVDALVLRLELFAAGAR
ncbi:ribosomal protein S18-alanine N-acetyltransferase [Roseinatronobacter sp.]